MAVLRKGKVRHSCILEYMSQERLRVSKLTVGEAKYAVLQAKDVLARAKYLMDKAHDLRLKRGR